MTWSCCCPVAALLEPKALNFLVGVLSLLLVVVPVATVTPDCAVLSLDELGDAETICHPFPASCVVTSSSCWGWFCSCSSPWLWSRMICCCPPAGLSPGVPPILLQVAASRARGDGCASYPQTKRTANVGVFYGMRVGVNSISQS